MGIYTEALKEAGRNPADFSLVNSRVVYIAATAQEAWKAKVLKGEVELEEIDTEPFRERYGQKGIPAQTIAKVAAAGGR